MDIFATALPALGEAFSLMLHPQQIMFLLAGVLLGLSIGVLPGLGGIAGLALVLPFMYGMEPVSGLALMVGLVAVIPTSDTFSSVLLGIPGSSASQATVLDGFPLARSGHAARALSAAFTRQRVRDALLMPVSVCLMTLIAGRSVWWRWRGKARWKGRVLAT